MTEIGFIGLGSMGAAMADRLLDEGHRVAVWNRSPGPVAELVARGAVAAESPREAFSGGVALSMLANDAAFDAVFDDEALAGLAGAVHVNMASISPETSRRAAARHAEAGVAYVAAPVLGRPPAAAAGQLHVLAAGDPAAIERAREPLEALSQRLWLLGDEPSQANVVKTAMNYMLIHTIQSLGESISLVERSGIDAGSFVELATSTMFGGVAHGVYGGIIAERRFRPAGFALELGLKDLGLAESIAGESGFELPSAPTLRALFEKALADPGLEGADWAAVTEVTRRA